MQQSSSIPDVPNPNQAGNTSKDSLGTVNFSSLINQYVNLQGRVESEVNQLAGKDDEMSPGKFLLVQFKMSKVVQVGESISNLISQIQSVINMAVRNQKSS